MEDYAKIQKKNYRNRFPSNYNDFPQSNIVTPIATKSLNVILSMTLT